ncbi:MAG: DUF4954 family protein [Treponema sp.]|jgi:NDP-sugar pyrophosphorylase family protein|nr:DUF4954 family protein [Treponema sp.]
MEMLPPEGYGYSFISGEYLPPGKDEYWIRNLQAEAVFNAAGGNPLRWRPLSKEEQSFLERSGCRSGCWADVLVRDPFDPALVRNSSFYGLVRMGPLENVLLRHHDFCIPSGIRNSVLVSCDIGANAAIQDCSLISHYIIGPRCILSRIDEMSATNHAKFGGGIIKEGETEDVRIWIDVMNEAGGRSVLPFPGMICADAYLWAAWRDDRKLVETLKEITQNAAGFPGVPSRRRGFYGAAGEGAVIKSCRIIKDAFLGNAAYIKGANKLKNVTILSSEEEPAQIGEGVELVNGIAGYGSRVFYGAKAVRFVLGNCSSLKYGARLIHSVLGDNSTVSCCEILNNLVFPVHEQHHNNSFLIAALIEGMSNMAAGATVGSNHNSRANDGEIRAGRGFWPGLSVTLKHSSRFASFCLIVKGDYPYELNIPFPFSLVNNNVRRDRLEVMPAYFWMYNLYALERNSWKTANRDRRRIKVQRIEADYLAPDTAEEIITALGLLETWLPGADPGGAKSLPPESGGGRPLPGEPDPLDAETDPEYDYAAPDEEALAVPGLERHSRPVVLLKPRRAMAAYREMLFYYGMKTVMAYLESHPETAFAAFTRMAARPGFPGGWVNLGGQIVPAFRVDALRRDIREGRIPDWQVIHARYDDMAASYEEDRVRHAWAALGPATDTLPHPLGEPGAFAAAVGEAVRIARRILRQVYQSRAKDFHDPFRAVTYRNQEEMEQVAGRAEDNPFVRLAEENLRVFEERARRIKKTLGGAEG